MFSVPTLEKVLLLCVFLFIHSITFGFLVGVWMKNSGEKTVRISNYENSVCRKSVT